MEYMHKKREDRSYSIYFVVKQPFIMIILMIKTDQKHSII